jgi:hypothetical protein
MANPHTMGSLYVDVLRDFTAQNGGPGIMSTVRYSSSPFSPWVNAQVTLFNNTLRTTYQSFDAFEVVLHNLTFAVHLRSASILGPDGNYYPLTIRSTTNGEPAIDFIHERLDPTDPANPHGVIHLLLTFNNPFHQPVNFSIGTLGGFPGDYL